MSSDELTPIAEIVRKKVRVKRFRPEGKCKTCQFSVQHKKFHADLLASTYFDENGVESVTMVINRWKVQKSLGYRNVMNHIWRHLVPVKKFNDEHAAELVPAEVTPLPANLEIISEAETAHERALDKTIAKFEHDLESGKLKMTASIGLQAIKIKADIVKSNKDRNLDIMKAFTSMGQKQNGEERVSD